MLLLLTDCASPLTIHKITVSLVWRIGATGTRYLDIANKPVGSRVAYIPLPELLVWRFCASGTLCLHTYSNAWLHVVGAMSQAYSRISASAHLLGPSDP